MNNKIYINYNLIEKFGDTIRTDSRIITMQKKDLLNYINNFHNYVLYLNLTNGLELYPFINNFKIIRIQSTAVEQNNYEYIIKDLDNGFLLDLALGKNCFVADFSQKRTVTKATTYGLEFIKTVLYKLWFNKSYLPIVKKLNLSNYYNKIIKSFDRQTIKKILYFKKFLLTDEIKIHTITGLTTNDNNYKYFNNLLKQ